MQGAHLIAEFFGCQGDPSLLHHADRLRDICLAKLADAGLCSLGDHFHQFAPHGTTGTTGSIIMAGAHLALHTWPEHGYVSLDIFVSNYTRDHTPEARQLFEAIRELFAPQQVHLKQLGRSEVPQWELMA